MMNDEDAELDEWQMYAALLLMRGYAHLEDDEDGQLHHRMVNALVLAQLEPMAEELKDIAERFREAGYQAGYQDGADAVTTAYDSRATLENCEAVQVAEGPSLEQLSKLRDTYPPSDYTGGPVATW